MARAILFSAMKILFVIAVLLVLGVSFLADYKWKQWLRRQEEARKEDRYR